MIAYKDQDTENKINAIVRNRTAVNTSFKESKLALAGFIVSETKTSFLHFKFVRTSSRLRRWKSVDYDFISRCDVN